MTRARTWPAAAACVAAIAYAAILLRSGARLSSDSLTYSRWADALIAARFNLGSFVATQHFVVPPTFYLLWISTLAAAKVVCGAAWPQGIVLLNWTCATLIVFGLARTVARLTTSAVVGVVASLVFVVAGDLLVFLPYVLSDILFVGISCVVLLAGLAIVAGQERTSRPVIVGSIFALLACAFRPTAAPLVAYWAACLFLNQNTARKRRHVRTLLVVLAAAVAVAIVAHAVIMQQPERWPLRAGAGWIRQLSTEAHEGIVVFGRQDTYVAPPVTIVQFAALTIVKTGYYFAPWLSAYSLSHKLIGAVFWLPVFALSMIAATRSPRWRLTYALGVYIAAFALYHGVQQIDYDHRYRLPVLPAFSVLAALGFEVLAADAIARYEPDYARLVPTTVQL